MTLDARIDGLEFGLCCCFGGSRREERGTDRQDDIVNKVCATCLVPTTGGRVCLALPSVCGVSLPGSSARGKARCAVCSVLTDWELRLTVRARCPLPRSRPEAKAGLALVPSLVACCIHTHRNGASASQEGLRPLSTYGGECSSLLVRPGNLNEWTQSIKIVRHFFKGIVYPATPCQSRLRHMVKTREIARNGVE